MKQYEEFYSYQETNRNFIFQLKTDKIILRHCWCLFGKILKLEMLSLRIQKMALRRIYDEVSINYKFDITD